MTAADVGSRDAGSRVWRPNGYSNAVCTDAHTNYNHKPPLQMFKKKIQNSDPKNREMNAKTYEIHGNS